ncbi:MAG: undecaprenyldiphospho-muramoylpentapeptide beta-N-acetylglucosaminyltransferase [Treponema sp.]|jgi:UDP-N-acetylglucosamine--N-acetylmuramyl-(pentapeptide) pyrophosphoryl-undecaprenol N-acetylglucosamine transferase|nr:undecaprenyldiphospho-muramoylpentapeptide beta-N-acetylglucosaminyltransferase [Treponema sp.]
MVSIAFTGGGTGGHIYPGLAVAAQLKKLLLGIEFRLFWIGSSSGMDMTLVKEAGIEFFGVPSGKLRRYFSLRTIVDFFKVVGGFFAARKILKKQKAVLLFSKGGFVSVPPCAAASSLRIPVFTHESDFSPGLATRLNTRFVMRTKGTIFTAYEDTARFFPPAVRKRVTVSGNPVRDIFRKADSAKGRAFLGLGEEARILLILGGSQGALQINELVRAALVQLTEVYTVVHQSGPNLAWDIPANDRYKPYPYIKEELPHVMAASELVMGRSGAGVWEWAVLGKPMLLIPLRGAGTRGDQVENARFFQSAGAALVLGEDVTAQSLVQAVNSLARDDEKRRSMAEASAKIGEKDASEAIARILADKLKDFMGEKG